MADLERFVRRMVQVLQSRDPSAVHQPVSVAELRERLLPYRIHRKALGLFSSEEYELVVLRLCAEEGGYVRTFPPDVAKLCQVETASPNPDLRLVEQIGDTTVQIGAGTLTRILSRVNLSESAPTAPSAVTPPESHPEESMPKPGPTPSPKPQQPVAAPVTSPTTMATPSALQCRFCSEALPPGRPVVYCPFCGRRILPVICSRCRTELEPEWKHCITCGRPTSESLEFA